MMARLRGVGLLEGGGIEGVGAGASVFGMGFAEEGRTVLGRGGAGGSVVCLA